ncbi:interleukin-1 receptor-like 2 isoform X3 [Cervus canadensis]|uniref:interleukin-1 receptor-like 2 isoform X3 n=1 Tax=Cervus canadensis TaxID=1574408 RepID=UPI001C9E5666|nr:interleukin-1 receptor-like 2 isoform X3 [Cervus canadensis]
MPDSGADRGMLFLLLCVVSIALPRFIRADACEDLTLQETASVDQPTAFNCVYSLPTSGKVDAMWYKYPSKIPISKNTQSRIHQDQNWILFLPVKGEDSGIYQCLINDTDICSRMQVNLTVFEKHWCGASGNSQLNMPHEYKQILQVGRDDILICHLNFPNNFYLDSVKWYKDCIEIEGERFISGGKKLLVKNVSLEDRGNYECQASLTHAKKQHTVFNSISVTVTEKVGNGGRIPKIIYPKNNSIEVKPGSMLIVNCNITDTRDNTNPRCWRVNNTLVDDYYGDSKRIQEGIENYTIFPEHIFYTVNITFLEVKMEDYGRPFVCHAGVSAAYFILKLPVPDFRAYLIGGLLILTGAVVSAMFIYNIFKIDIVLWYRSSFHSAGPIEAVVNVIDENIRLCRRLIIVIDPDELSFDLLKNLSEEQIAVYSALIQDGIKVILIELGKVNDYTALPESIQYIKQKHGAVRWSGDFTEQSQCAKTQFWKKVRYRMPPKRWPPSPPVQLLKHTPFDLTAGKWEARAGFISPDGKNIFPSVVHS